MKMFFIFSLLLFYFNVSYAFTANIWGCDIEIPDIYKVDTRYEGNLKSIKFISKNTLSYDFFSVLDKKVGLHRLKEKMDSKDIDFVGEYFHKGFLIKEFSFFEKRFDVVIGKDQLVYFHSESRKLWSDLVENCSGGGGLDSVNTDKITNCNTNDSVKVRKLLLENSKLSITRDDGQAIGIKVYNVSEKFSKSGLNNGDLITKICDEKINESLDFSSCCGLDEYIFHVKSDMESKVSISIPNE